MNSSKVILVAVWLQHNKNWDDTYKAIITKVSPDDFFIEEAKRYINNYGEQNIITPMDEEFKNLGLNKIKHPPFVVNLVLCN